MHAKVVALLAALGAALVVPSSRPVARAAQVAVEVADVDLAGASRGVMVRIGSPRNRDVLTIPLELYVAQVLSAEGEPNAHDAARQALAIAIRTYALFNTGRHEGDGYDLCDTTHCQVLRASSAASRRAAQATLGQVLTYQGAPADLYYSASCGGHTERAEDVWEKVSLPYLHAVEDDVHADDVPWTLEKSLEEIRAALARAGVRGRRLDDLIVESRTPSGRVGRVGLPGLEPASMNSNDFRLALGPTELRSTAFTMTRSGDRITFTGRGYGHGVGMCVIGAGRRAVRGESAAQILERYYPGLALEDVSRVVRGVAPRPPVTAPAATASAAPAPAPAPPAARPTPPTPPAPFASPALPASGSIRAFVPSGSAVAAADLQRITSQAMARVAARLAVTPAPLTIRLHDTLDGFRRATGQPWWVSARVREQEIDLAPAAIINQRDGLDLAVARAVAEALVTPALGERRAWVRVGAARYFAGAAPGTGTGDTDGRLRCPDDLELTGAVSAAAQREAEARAEACFAQAIRRGNDWRSIR
jgi:SpoIID/LytB domain protein